MRWLLVGLGNPGIRYAQHRHNIGFVVVDALAARAQAQLRASCYGQLAATRFGADDVGLFKPMTYMNHSGQAVREAAARYELPVGRIVVLHDDIDLTFGRLKVKVGGGHGGHNGLRSIADHVGRDFLRIRMGVGRPSDGDVTSHVLGDFSPAERLDLGEFVDRAHASLESVLGEGPETAMNRFNGASDLGPVA